MKHGERRRSIRRWGSLRWRLAMFVFEIMLLSGILTALVYIILRIIVRFLPFLTPIVFNPTLVVFVLLGTSTIIGTALATHLGTYYLRPLNRLVAATKEVKSGNFKVQVRVNNKTVEEAPVKLPREIDLLVESFNDMVRELDSIELFRNDFINNFSHEFKTPIVSIRGFARELQKGELSEEQRQEYAKIIAEESDRLVNLSTNVLRLSKLENQQILGDRTEFYLDEQLRQCILLFEQNWSEKEIEMIPELNEVRVCFNEEMLSHIWKNLISNAIKFTSQGGNVRVTLEDRDGFAVVTVADSGIGMNEEVKAHIFEKFYQGDPSHHHTGYGIGLTVVKRAVQLCGGKIKVESTPGQGSTFTVLLPLERKKEVVVGEVS